MSQTAPYHAPHGAHVNNIITVHFTIHKCCTVDMEIDGDSSIELQACLETHAASGHACSARCAAATSHAAQLGSTGPGCQCLFFSATSQQLQNTTDADLAPLSEAWGRQRPGAARSTPGRVTTRYARPWLLHWTKGRRQLRLVRHSLGSKILPQSENILSTPVRPQVPP